MSLDHFHRPSSLAEALDLKARYGADARFVAGGTDLLVKMRAGVVAPGAIIDLNRLAELRTMVRGDGVLRIGACVTAATVREDRWLCRHFPALTRAARWLGGPQMQHVATIGGNLANASPAADTVPALMAAGATVVLEKTGGHREMPFEDFLAGPGRTVIEADEIVREVRVPLASFDPPDPRPAEGFADDVRLNRWASRGSVPGSGEWTTNAFYKVGPRLAQVISVACFAGWLRVRDGVVVDARFAYGSAAPVTKRGLHGEEAVKGRALDPDVIESAVAAISNDISPIDDVRGSAAYKSALCANATRAFLQDAAGRDLAAPPVPAAGGPAK